MLIETHAHLDYPDFANDFDDVLRRATEAGVSRIITIGTAVESSQRAVELAEKYPNVFAVIGVHPTYAQEAGEDVITPLRELAKNPRVVAIGEIGLDYHRLPSVEAAKQKHIQVFNALQSETEEQIEAGIEDGAYKSKQAELFEQLLDLAVELRLNVVIHQRDAWDDTLESLRDYGRQVSGVFHCFGGTHLAPVPFRGKRCEPAHTRLVAEEIAKARGASLEEIAGATTATAEEFFRFERG